MKRDEAGVFELKGGSGGPSCSRPMSEVKFTQESQSRRPVVGHRWNFIEGPVAGAGSKKIL